MKNISRLALVLGVLFLIVTANKSNASVRSQQDNKSISFNDYLPNYTVNTNIMDSEEPVMLARRWGRFKRKHVCFDRNNKRHPRKRYTYRSQWCRNKRAKKARRARNHYRSIVVKYHKRKAQIKRTPVCKVSKSLLNPRGLSQRKIRCYNPPPWPTAAQRAAKTKKERLAAVAAARAEKARLAAAATARAEKARLEAEARAKAQPVCITDGSVGYSCGHPCRVQKGCPTRPLTDIQKKERECKQALLYVRNRHRYKNNDVIMMGMKAKRVCTDTVCSEFYGVPKSSPTCAGYKGTYCRAQYGNAGRRQPDGSCKMVP